jgi:hypothetical protein
MDNLLTKPEKAKIIVSIIAAFAALSLGLSILFGASSETILPGPDQYNEAGASNVSGETASTAGFAVRSSTGDAVRGSSSPYGEVAAAEFPRGPSAIAASNLSPQSAVESFNYEAYTYTAFWYHWYQAEDGSWTTEPLLQEGLSYSACLQSQYCNPDLAQGRTPIMELN